MSLPVSRSRFRLRAVLAAVATILLAATLFLIPTAGSASAGGRHGPKPTVVLVHGAFADASGWADVTTRLQRQGYTVISPANPLRGVATDSAYVASVLREIVGPKVLVGHSYGGEVITNAAYGRTDVSALVYVAAFAPDEGESSGQLTGMFPGSRLTPDNLIVRPFPISATESGADAYIKPAVFRSIFCVDLSPKTAAAMGSAQRPGALDPVRDPARRSGGPSRPGISSPARTGPSRPRPNASWPTG